MKGLVYKAIKWGLDKGKSVDAIQQYIFIKHKISIGKKAVLERIKYNHKK
jgi:hypothetical protein